MDYGRGVSLREVRWHYFRPVGNVYRIICDPIILFLEACVLDCSLIARIDTKDGSSLCKALVDRRLRQADHARDLLGRFSFEQRVEAGAVFVRQPRPTLEVGLTPPETIGRAQSGERMCQLV